MATVTGIGVNTPGRKDENEKTPYVAGMSAQTCASSLNKNPQRDSYWFAHGGVEELSPKNAHCNSNSKLTEKEKEEKIRLFREQQEEERVKRLRDLEQQFLQAKRHREQQEEERKRKIEEARIREIERRQQVEERKRQIWEAEQERKEAILRRNMEREARIEARRNAQRNSQCFAFGSSTPRTFDLDLAAIGVGRNFSQGSVLMSSVSRRSEERELGPPRATSACSLDRKCGEDNMSRSMVSLSSAAFRGRKRTDIMPTLTRERSITPHVSQRGKDTSRSPSRPQSSMSGASEISQTSSSISAVNMRPRPAPRRPRPYSIAGSTLDHSSSANVKAVKKEQERQPRPTEKNATNVNSKPLRAKSAGRDRDDAEKSRPLTAPKKPVPPPKSSEVLARAKAHPVPTKDNLRKMVKSSVQPTDKKPEEKPTPKDSEIVEKKKENISDHVKPATKSEENTSGILISPAKDSVVNLNDSDVNTSGHSVVSAHSSSDLVRKDDDRETNDILPVADSKNDDKAEVKSEGDNIPDVIDKSKDIDTTKETASPVSSVENGSEAAKEMVSSKIRITSEEEAKAALAEKRRLAREQAEKEAELERQRQEEIRRREEEQRRLEELEQKRLEEEQIRLAELHRKLEEEKLQKAIEEQKQREKEEQERKEMEARLKAEKEEQERKAREDAEKQRLELEERLKKEEEERAERKRRVEQIMARTRAKAAQNMTSPQTEMPRFVKDSGTPNSAQSPLEHTKPNVVPQASPAYTSNGYVESKIETNSHLNRATESFISTTSSSQFSADNRMSSSAPLPDLLNSEVIANHSVKNNGHVACDPFSTSVTNNVVTSNRTLSANEAISPTQSNGYSSHEDMSCTTSPEETADTGLLIDIDSVPQKNSRVASDSTNYTKLVEIEPSSFNMNNENYLLNVDEVNSNLMTSGNSYPFEDSLQKKQESPLADLLS